MYLSNICTVLTLTALPQGTPTPPKPDGIYLPKHLIAVEEHAVSPSLEAEVLAAGVVQRYPGVQQKLEDLGAGRLAAMDRGNVTLTVLAQQSASGLTDPDICSKANHAIRKAVDAILKRFAGFAVIPMALPDQAAAELERSVEQLGFKGAMIWNHLADGTYYDAAKIWPVFAKAQELNVPIYLHPAAASQDIFSKLYAGNYDAATAGRLGTNSGGWHVDVGLHVLRLYSAGLFIRYPKLKLMIGHNGEGVPIFIDRIDSTGLRNDTTFNNVWNTNIWSTTSAIFTVRQFQQLRQVSPIERIMYSVDYPHNNYTAGWQFVQAIADGGVLTNREMDMFADGNAQKLLKL